MQILEGLLKLPENRECADCQVKYVTRKIERDDVDIVIANTKIEIVLMQWTFCRFYHESVISFILIIGFNNCLITLQRSKMGKCEFRYLYMHAMFWDPQKSRRTHIKGDFLISVVHTLSLPNSESSLSC